MAAIRRSSFADLLVVAAEKLQKAGLGAGRSLHAAGLERRQAMLDFLQVLHQVVGPQAGPLAHRRGLGRLEVGKAQAGKAAIPCGERGQAIDGRHQPGTQQLERFAEQDQIGIVGDVAARRARWMMPRASGQSSP